MNRVCVAIWPGWRMLSLAWCIGNLCGCRVVSDGDIREAMRAELCRYYGELPSECGGHVNIVSAKDVPQALSMFDSYIVPTLDDRSDARINKMQRLVETGKAWMYCRTDIDGYRHYTLMNLFPSCDSGEYGFVHLDSTWNNAEGRLELPVESRGFLTLSPKDNGIMLPHYANSHYEEYCAQLPHIDDTLDYNEREIRDRNLYAAGVYPDRIDISAIVDVVDVQLMGVTGFNYSRTHPCYFPGCRAEYHVRLDVRKVEKGDLSSKICILETKPFWEDFNHEGFWKFYPGMTLRVGLQNDDGIIRLVEDIPVEPYPPYAAENVRISGGGRVRHPHGAGSCARDLIDDFDGQLEPLVVEYGTHTKVEFRHGDIITFGNRASFADFGVTSRFKILEMKEGANKKYWGKAWFVTKEK